MLMGTIGGSQIVIDLVGMEGGKSSFSSHSLLAGGSFFPLQITVKEGYFIFF